MLATPVWELRECGEASSPEPVQVTARCHAMFLLLFSLQQVPRRCMLVRDRAHARAFLCLFCQLEFRVMRRRDATPMKTKIDARASSILSSEKPPSLMNRSSVLSPRLARGVGYADLCITSAVARSFRPLAGVSGASLVRRSSFGDREAGYVEIISLGVGRDGCRCHRGHFCQPQGVGSGSNNLSALRFGQLRYCSPDTQHQKSLSLMPGRHGE